MVNKCICGKELGGDSFYWEGQLYCSTQCAGSGMLQGFNVWKAQRERRLVIEEINKQVTDGVFKMLKEAGWSINEIDASTFGKTSVSSKKDGDELIVTITQQINVKK